MRPLLLLRLMLLLPNGELRLALQCDQVLLRPRDL